MTPQKTLLTYMRRNAISLDALAKAMGFKGASSVQRYLGEDYATKPYSLRIGRKMVDALEALGADPLHRDGLLASLCGLEAQMPPLPTGDPKPLKWLPELDVQASMGDGLAVQAEHQIASWGIPTHDMPQAQGAVYIITAVGDSMSPTILPGQKVAIDTGHLIPSPGGIYAIHDGDTLTLKRVERDMEAEGKAYRVSSDNPAFKAYTIRFEENSAFKICGRMLATWQWS